MITATLVVMTVMGCGDGVVQCSPVKGPEQIWSSKTACERAIPVVLRRSMHLDFPVVAARCDSNGKGGAAKTVVAAATDRPFKAVRIEPAVKVLRSDEIPSTDSANPSVARAVLNGAWRGVEVVGRTASQGYDLVSVGTRASYDLVRDGLVTTTQNTVGVARKAAGIVSKLVD